MIDTAGSSGPLDGVHDSFGQSDATARQAIRQTRSNDSL